MSESWERRRGGDLLGPMTLVLSRAVVPAGKSDNDGGGGGDGGGESDRDDPWREAR